MKNPWPNIPKSEQFRLISTIPASERDKVLSLLCQKGSLQSTINHLWSKLTRAIHENHITTRASLEQFISSSILCPATDPRELGLDGGIPPDFMPTTPHSYEPRGIAAVCSKAEGTEKTTNH